jgi:hypothetical protein
MATTITLTFVTVPIESKDLSINITAAGVPLPLFLEDFVNLRSERFQSTAPAAVTLADAASNYADAYNLDYGNHGGVNSSVANAVGNVVTITFNIDSWQVQAPIGQVITDGDITYVINNDLVEDDKTVEVINYEAHLVSPCAFCLVNSEATGGNDVYHVYKYPDLVKVLDAVASPFQLQLNRGENNVFRVTDTLDEFIGEFTTTAPKAISSKKITVSLQNLSSGTTATIDVEFISNDILPYQYSLDDITYQSQNVFSGLVPDNYTVYVKDAFGCVRQVDFVADGVTEVPDTIFTISEINALRLARIDSEKKNHKNTLSCDELKRLTYSFTHRFTLEDDITTQYKTNAQYRNVYAVDGNGNQTPLTSVKMTDNIGLEAKSTCTYFDWGNGRSAVFFGEVDILNPLTDAVIETTDFGFTLPEWANTIGNFVILDGGIGEVEINAIGYSDFYSSFVIIFNIQYLGAPVERKLSATYNLQPYEVYEFIADMSALPELYNIVIEVGRDSSNIDFTYISEKIKRVVDNDRLLEILYSDPENRGNMVYQTGITHRLRLEGVVDSQGESITEGYNGDSNFFVTDNTVYDGQRFVFYRLSSEMVHKLRLVMPHFNLVINGLAYKIAEAPEIRTDINNNLKTFSVILKRGGEEFLTAEQEIINVGAKGVAEAEAKAAALEASKGKSLLLYTK